MIKSLIALTGATVLLTAPAAVAAVHTHGTPGDDVLTGTSGADTIHGRGGDDRIKGLGGADRLFGGSGRDDLYGGRGADVLRGGSGTNSLHGGPGADRLLASGRDYLNGGAGDDLIVAGITLLPADGGRGDDVLRVRRGAGAWFVGGPGDDLLVGGARQDLVVDPGTGEDVVKTYGRNDQIGMWNDGDRDVIRCGAGRHDWVGYHDSIDPHDVFHGCETVEVASFG